MEIYDPGVALRSTPGFMLPPATRVVASLVRVNLCRAFFAERVSIHLACANIREAMKHTTPDAQIEQVRNSFQKALNRHGIGFQFSVLTMAENLATNVNSDARSRWGFLFSEVPAEVQGGVEDFLLHTSRDFY